MLFAELRALLNLTGVPGDSECCRLPLDLAGEKAHLEITVSGDRLRLRAIVASLHEPGTDECLCMLDWNLFAACSGGIFAIDDHGAKYLLRYVPCGPLSDVRYVHELVMQFSADAREFFDELFERATAVRLSNSK